MGRAGRGVGDAGDANSYLDGSLLASPHDLDVLGVLGGVGGGDLHLAPGA